MDSSVKWIRRRSENRVQNQCCLQRTSALFGVVGVPLEYHVSILAKLEVSVGIINQFRVGALQPSDFDGLHVLRVVSPLCRSRYGISDQPSRVEGHIAIWTCRGSPRVGDCGMRCGGFAGPPVPK
ncbi:hypothetical protein U1Q18_045573 [Sarracenia purpurea var. burkii]